MIENRNVYVGHRYVPKVIGEWAKNESYEGLSIVIYKGDSYTSKKRVPKGIDIANEEYWVVTGNYNAQIEEYRQEVKENSLKILNSVKKNELVINVKDYGVVGDGVTNDTANFNKAVEAAKLLKGTLFVPYNMIVVLDEVTTKGVTSMKIDGVLNTPQITIGNTSNNTHPLDYYLREINGVVKCVGIKNGLTHINKASKVLLYANGDDPSEYSIAYAKFMFGQIHELEMDSVGDEPGWINENILIGGRLDKITFKGNYEHNGNVWYKPQFDNAVINIQKGHTNVFHDCRFEGNVVVTFSEGTHDNVFEKIYQPFAGSLYSSGLYNSTLNDQGYNNKVYNLLEQYQKRNTIYKMDGFSNNYNVNDIVPTSQNKLSAKAWSEIFKTGKFEIEDDISLKFKADVAGFRCNFKLYDVNGNIVTDLNNDVIQVNFAKGSENEFYSTVDTKDVTVSFKKNTKIKYVEFGIQTGSNDIVFSKLSLTLIAPITSNVHIPYDTKYDKARANKIPTSGNYEKGYAIENDLSLEQTYSGWICTASGTPGTWKGYGQIEQ